MVKSLTWIERIELICALLKVCAAEQVDHIVIYAHGVPATSILKLNIAG